MAKSIRSKIKKRFRTCKRQRVDAVIEKPRLKNIAKKLQDTINGTTPEFKKAKNMFLYPNDPESEIPQMCVTTPVDFRAEKMPMAGYAFRGNRRKYVGDQLDAQQKKLKEAHPKMKVLAGKKDKNAPELASDSEDEEDDDMEMEKKDDMAGEVDLSSMMLPADLAEADTKRKPVVKQKKATRVRPQVFKKQKISKK